MRVKTEQPGQDRQNKPPITAPQEQELVSEADIIHSIPNLQQIIGNQAVQRLLDTGSEPVALDPGMRAASVPVQDSRRIRMHANRPDRLQKRAVDGTPSQTYSNTTPGALLTHTSVVRYPFRVTIRQGTDRDSSKPARAATSRLDAAPGEEHGAEEFQSLFEELGAESTANAEEVTAAAETGATQAPPETGIQAPTSATQAPTSETQASATATQAPTSATQAPASGTQAPTSATQAPTSETQASATATQAPTSATQAPASGTQAPTSATQAPTSETQAPTSETQAPAEETGTPIQIPDIEIPILATIETADSVISGLAYSGSITRGGATPTGYGVTRSFFSRLTHVTILHPPGIFVVAGTFEHPITYQIRSGTGPHGEVDIASDTDPDITNANYSTVVSDLTPNMGDLNGRPPGWQPRQLPAPHKLRICSRKCQPGLQLPSWLRSPPKPANGVPMAMALRLTGRVLMRSSRKVPGANIDERRQPPEAFSPAHSPTFRPGRSDSP
jgi:hypothetical protein